MKTDKIPGLKLPGTTIDASLANSFSFAEDPADVYPTSRAKFFSVGPTPSRAPGVRVKNLGARDRGRRPTITMKGNTQAVRRKEGIPLTFSGPDNRTDSESYTAYNRGVAA